MDSYSTLQLLILPDMTKKEIIAIVLKSIVAVCGIVGAAFGIFTLTSCNAYKNAAATGRTSIVTVDSTTIDHSSGFSVEIKRK